MWSAPPQPLLVGKAIELYMELAYPQGPSSSAKAIMQKLESWAGDFWANPVFIRSGSAEQAQAYSLRLGNSHYPHMKLRIEALPDGTHYFFRADAHDTHITLSHDHPEYGAWRQLCRENHDLAAQIESQWQHADVPTFVGYMDEDLAQRRHRHEGEHYVQAAHHPGR